MKSILQYGQAIKAAKRAKSVKGSIAIASSAGDALRDGYKLKGYVKVNNGNLSYWRKGNVHS
jgi:hypothetical protein